MVEAKKYREHFGEGRKMEREENEDKGMSDLGEKWGGDTAVIGSSQEDKPHYPSINLKAKTLPALEDYEVGDTVDLMVRAELTGFRKERDGEAKYDLDLKSAKCVGKSPMDSNKKSGDEE